jgi:hypothetical protein
MKTFTIDTDNNISAFATAEEAAATNPSQSFGSQKELEELATAWPAERLVAVWNSLPGVKPVKGFKSGNAAASRIWERIQGLGAPAQPEAEPAKPKAERKAKGGAKAPKGKATKKATAAKKAPKTPRTKAPKPAKRESGAPREGSKTAQVVAMLQRVRDHGEDGLASPHGSRVYGWRPEGGGPRGRILQARGRRAHLPHQHEVASGPSPFRPPGTAAAGFLLLWQGRSHISKRRVPRWAALPNTGASLGRANYLKMRTRYRLPRGLPKSAR